jgi:hypothetical protein
MAGTLFGLPMSQRVDSNGKPAVGWLLYIFQANTSTPVNSYQDTGLTVLNTWPIQADSYGMMGVFWLPDGSYRARGTSNDGSIIYFDMPNVLSIGPSTGAPPPSGVDPNAIWRTGDIRWLDQVAPIAGWVRDNSRYIGSATSGADERANADCQPLFEWLWNSYTGIPPVVLPSRGSTSLSDWTANKRIQMPDKRGFITGGLDDMGNVAAGRWSALVPVVWGVGYVTPGGLVGDPNVHLLTNSEMPTHGHVGTTDAENQGHTHTYQQPQSINVQAGGGALGIFPGQFNTFTTSDRSQSHTHTFTTGNAGGGQYHSITQYTVLGTYYRKL